ncbi:MAG: hypothetical protein ACOCZB_07980 [Spirochaetota bacterium]
MDGVLPPLPVLLAVLSIRDGTLPSAAAIVGYGGPTSELRDIFDTLPLTPDE